MHMNIMIGCVLMILTTAVHALATLWALRVYERMCVKQWNFRSHWLRVTVVSMFILIMFIASVFEATIWAGAYLMLDAFSSAEEALYFSMVTYTTLGYGDVVMEEGRRLLASFEAANGIIMFGWTTAMIVAVVHRIYFSHVEPDTSDA